jgi:hypothetical protein
VSIGLSFLQQYSEAGYSSLDVVGLIYEGLGFPTRCLFTSGEEANSGCIMEPAACMIDPESVKEVVLRFVAAAGAAEPEKSMTS